MTFSTRMMLIAALICMLAGRIVAQQEPAPPASAAPAAAAASSEDVPATRDSNLVSSEFSMLLRNHPPELATILALDPTLLSNDAFLAGYPKLSAFVAANPEVRRNPRFFLSDFEPHPQRSELAHIVEALSIISGFALMAFTFAWLVRTVIEQKRWSRLSRTQSEVHNKILDRFSSSGELLDYIKTPAGTKFLESAPIPLRAEPAQSAPLTRIMWSTQFGVVVIAAALGLLLVSSRLEKEAAQALFALGVIAFSIGAGFIASAFISLVMSKRLGLWQNGAAADDRLEDSEPVR